MCVCVRERERERESEKGRLPFFLAFLLFPLFFVTFGSFDSFRLSRVWPTERCRRALQISQNKIWRNNRPEVKVKRKRRRTLRLDFWRIGVTALVQWMDPSTLSFAWLRVWITSTTLPTPFHNFYLFVGTATQQLVILPTTWYTVVTLYYDLC